MAYEALQAAGVAGAADLEIGTVTAAEVTGNSNGFVEAGEQGSITIQLNNFGVNAATGITATLTSNTPGVTVTPPGTSAYPDIPATNGSATNSTPFQFVIAGSPSCPGPLNFTLTLSYTGESTATVTILDNDSPPSATNPIDRTDFFVRQHYHDFLNREPDPAGFAFWQNEIESCGADAQCREVKRINVSAAFFLSIEFQGTGGFVYHAYTAAFGPTRIGSTVPLTFQEFLPDAQQVGGGVVFGQPGADALLEANKRAYLLEFAQRPAFTAQYPNSMTPEQFVDALNANTGNSLTPSERNDLVAQLSGNNTTQGRADVLRRVVDNAAFQARERNRAFVLMQYFGYLRRDPNSAPDTDFSGYNFWLNKLNSFNGNFVAAEMVKAFISSIEYRQRFGQ